ncbi:MAG: tetratricopeptide repeat protein [Deltaproteobacteria bacterium]|nr:tetratricopeptide repeat protein [Deltaproteobacteria bacterium]
MKFLDRVFGERSARARGLADRARVLLEKGQNERAQDDLVKALRLDPDSPEARELYAGFLFRRGLVRWTDGDLAGAVAEFSRSLKVVQNPIVMFRRGLVHKEAREYLRAIEDLSKVVRTEDPRSIPYLVWALAARGECYQEMGELKGALKDFQVCIEQRAGGPAAYRYLFKCAGIEKQLGNAGKARELCERALAIRPGFKPAEVLRAALAGGGEEKRNHRDTETPRSEGEEKQVRKKETSIVTAIASPQAHEVEKVESVITAARPVTIPPRTPGPMTLPAAVAVVPPLRATDHVVEESAVRGAAEDSTRRLAAQTERAVEARAPKRVTTRVIDAPASEQVSFWERNAIPRPASASAPATVSAEHFNAEAPRRKEATPVTPFLCDSAPLRQIPAPEPASKTVAAPAPACAAAPATALAPARATGQDFNAKAQSSKDAENEASSLCDSAPLRQIPAPALPSPATVEGRLLGKVETLLKTFDRDGGPALDDSIDFLILADQLRTRAVRTNGHAEAVLRAESRAREVVAANALVPFVRELSDEAGDVLTRTNDEILHDRVTRHRARVLVRRFKKLTRAERFLFFESCGAERFSRFSTLVDLADAGRLA